MSVIKKYIASYLIKENFQGNEQISNLFLKSIYKSYGKIKKFYDRSSKYYVR